MKKLPIEVQEELLEKGNDASVLIILLFRYHGFGVTIIKDEGLGVGGDALIKSPRKLELFGEMLSAGDEFYLEIKGRRMMIRNPHNLPEDCLGLEEEQFNRYMERYEKEKKKTLYAVVNAETKGYGKGIFFQWAHELNKEIKLAKHYGYRIWLNFPVRLYVKLGLL